MAAKLCLPFLLYPLSNIDNLLGIYNANYIFAVLLSVLIVNADTVLPAVYMANKSINLETENKFLITITFCIGGVVVLLQLIYMYLV